MRALNANAGESELGVLTERPGVADERLPRQPARHGHRVGAGRRGRGASSRAATAPPARSSGRRAASISSSARTRSSARSPRSTRARRAGEVRARLRRRVGQGHDAGSVRPGLISTIAGHRASRTPARPVPRSTCPSRPILMSGTLGCGHVLLRARPGVPRPALRLPVGVARDRSRGARVQGQLLAPLLGMLFLPWTALTYVFGLGAGPGCLHAGLGLRRAGIRPRPRDLLRADRPAALPGCTCLNPASHCWHAPGRLRARPERRS